MFTDTFQINGRSTELFRGDKMFRKDDNATIVHLETLLANQLSLSKNQKIIMNNQVALDKKLDKINKKLDELLEK